MGHDPGKINSVHSISPKFRRMLLLICSPTFLFSPYFCIVTYVVVCLYVCSHRLGYGVYLLYPLWWDRCLWDTVGDEFVLGMVLGAAL